MHMQRDKSVIATTEQMRLTTAKQQQRSMRAQFHTDAAVEREAAAAGSSGIYDASGVVY